MNHFRTAAFLRERTFVDTVEIEMAAGYGRGYAAYVRVEVEFTAQPDTSAGYDDPGAAGDREITAVRPFEYKHGPEGQVTTERVYLDCPRWLKESLTDCIDVQALTADWSE